MNNSLDTAGKESLLRQLIHELAKGIAKPVDLIRALGFTEAQYEALQETRAFKQLLNEAIAEWASAGNTQKRIKLKTAAGLEDRLPYLINAIGEERHDLKDRVAAFVALSRVAGLGVPDPVVQGDRGQYFKLEIHLNNKKDPVVIDGGIVDGGIVDGGAIERQGAIPDAPQGASTLPLDALTRQSQVFGEYAPEDL